MTADRQPASLSTLDDVRQRVDARLTSFLEESATQLRDISPVADRLTEPLRAFAAGGKRVRAVLLWWGYELAGGRDASAVASAAGSVELLHAAALVHDDIIDASETRRGSPAVHAHFRDHHRSAHLSGDALLYGTSAAIIAGDLCLALSEQLFDAGGFTLDAAARAAHAELRRDVMLGQFLDVELQAARVPRAELRTRADEVLTHKTAKYTVVQPLVLGAALAGASQSLRDGLTAFGLPLGRAFQMRDDVLGVFGDPRVTGKPAGDDLVQGKRTILVAEVLERARPADADWFERRLGQPHMTEAEVDRMSSLIVDSGALAAFEDLIEQETGAALTALDALAEQGLASADVATLRTFADALTDRRS
ncbi:MAG TPA: polyprenyl synthetase family protein [Candidatus Brevibacterium intestinigallinarum]|nr:polyprenyl synthetase family protein [Candidatus Brevibacterium intestinigallinarum]